MGPHAPHLVGGGTSELYFDRWSSTSDDPFELTLNFDIEDYVLSLPLASSNVVYNIGGSRHSNCSVLEAITLCEEISGGKARVHYSDEARSGDHIWYVSDVSKFRAHYPDGKTETLLVIPNYNFDWQLQYRWPPDKVKFAKGTRIDCVAHYDNSAFNPYNPDPKATVRFGQQTEQEMMNGFFFYTDEGEDLNLTIDDKTGRAKDP